jgi:hypothetical protein
MSWIVRIALLSVLLSVTIAAWGGRAHFVSAQDQIYVDAMDSPATGLLSNQSSNPDRFLIGYQNSQYIIQALEPSYEGDFYSFVALPDSASTMVEVDVAIAGDLRGKYALLGCRAGAEHEGYMLELHPEDGGVALWRSDIDGNYTELQIVHGSAAVFTGNASNHLAIDCAADTITGYVNGQAVVSATDYTYAAGQSYIGAGAAGKTADGLLVGFDNLTITDRVGAETSVGPGLITTDQPVSQDGMSAITDPRLDPQGTLDDAVWLPMTVDPSASELAGSVDLGSEFLNMPAGVQLQDVYAEMTFVTPPSYPVGAWAVGFGFWSDPAGNFYDIYVDVANGSATWKLGQGTSDGGYRILQSGVLPPGAVDLTPGAENYLSLVVYQGVVILSGNNFGVDAVVELPVQPMTGDVFAEVGFAAANPAETATLPMSVSGFSVWDMSGGMVFDLLSIPSGGVGQSSL